MIRRHLDEENQDVAGAYIDSLLAMEPVRREPALLATGLWLKGQRLLTLREDENALPYLMQAEDIAAEGELTFLQSEILKSRAEIAIGEGDFEGIQQHLLKAASLSRLAREPVKEIRAYTYLSIMAAKLKLHEAKYDYLYQAKSLMIDYKLDPSHYMLLDYHFALFAEESDEQKSWYQRVLTRPRTPENAWVFKSAATNLVKLLIDGEAWDEAFDVIAGVEHLATAHKLKADVYFARGDSEKALQEAETAFNIARVSGDSWIGVYVAYMLLEHSIAVGDTVKASEYRQYFQTNLKGRWKGWRKEQLATLGVTS